MPKPVPVDLRPRRNTGGSTGVVKKIEEFSIAHYRDPITHCDVADILLSYVILSPQLPAYRENDLRHVTTGLPMFMQELARSGRALFKIRGHYINAIIAFGVVVAFFTHSWGPFENAKANMLWFWISLAVALAGAFIRVQVNGHAALGTSGKVKVAAEAAELNITGAYSLVRNPLYVGRIVNFTGIAMLTGSALYGAIIFFLSVLVYERISAYEEDFLAGKFGLHYNEWAVHVPALLPRLHGWVAPKYPFWWRRMLWREYKKFFQLGTALFFYDLARRGFDRHALPVNFTWYYAYGALCAARVGFKVAKMRGVFRDLR